MLRYCHFWILLGIISLLLVQCSPGQANECESNTAEFIVRSRGMQTPQYCVAFHDRFDTHDPQYRINFTESEVESVCSSNVCKIFFELVVLGCITFVSECVVSIVDIVIIYTGIYACIYVSPSDVACNNNFVK